MVGAPRVVSYAAVQKVLYGLDELAVAGGLAGESQEIVKCKTVDLVVAAEAEIEGRCFAKYLPAGIIRIRVNSTGLGGLRMIIGFGFGSPLESLLMLILTSILSYSLYRAWRNLTGKNPDRFDKREQRRAFYMEQRERAREMMREWDLTDEEIERRLDREEKND